MHTGKFDNLAVRVLYILLLARKIIKEIQKWVNVQLLESQVSLLVNSSRFTNPDQPGIDGISIGCGTPVPRGVQDKTAGSQRGRQ